MSANSVHTSIGIIDIDDNVEGYIFNEEPGITLGREIIIKTCKTRVVVTEENGNERILEPLVIESCMHPEIKTIMPLTIRAVCNENRMLDTIYVSNPYESMELDLENKPISVRTENFMPISRRK